MWFLQENQDFICEVIKVIESGKIVKNIIGREKLDICGYCGYPVKKCVCSYKEGMLRGE